LIKEKIIVNIKYQEIEQTFIGEPNQVWISINRFFGEIVPALNTMSKVILTINLERLIDDCKNVIGITPEGPVLLISKQKLTDSETLSLQLLATFLGNKLGQTKDSLTKEELQLGLGKTGKITSTRLGELYREGLVIKTEDGKYRITTLGIKRLQEVTLPDIKKNPKII
jgi:hypothetical protein